MKQIKIYRNPTPKIFIWLGAIAFILLVVNLIYAKDIFNSNSIFLFVFSALYFGQHFYHKSWVLKIDEENIYTRSLFLTRTNVVPYADILSHKVLVTGDMELKLRDKEVVISKDEISKADFQEILDKINQVTQ